MCLGLVVFDAIVLLFDVHCLRRLERSMLLLIIVYCVCGSWFMVCFWVCGLLNFWAFTVLVVYAL